MDAKTAWPDRVTIDGTVHKARVEAGNGTVSLPYTTEPQVSEGDVITQAIGRREVAFEVLDVSFQPNGSLGIGTIHRHLLVLSVEPTTSQAHTQPPSNVDRNDASGSSASGSSASRSSAASAGASGAGASGSRASGSDTSRPSQSRPAPPPAAAVVSKAAPQSTLRFAELVERIAVGRDVDAKTAMLALLDNTSVANVIGLVETLRMRASLQPHD